MLKAARWLNLTCGLEILSLGRQTGLERADCVMEIVGSQLLLRIELRGTWIWLSAASLDEGGESEAICNFPDGPQGWRDVCKLVQALERSGLTSLKEHPVRLGTEGPRLLRHRLSHELL